MSARAEQRYATAADVASDVRRWLADEPVSAYREPLTAQVRRWGRKHRSLVTGLSALVLTATLALVVGLVVIEGQRHETPLALERVTEEEKKTSAARDLAAEQRKLALETLHHPISRRKSGSPATPAAVSFRTRRVPALP